MSNYDGEETLVQVPQMLVEGVNALGPGVPGGCLDSNSGPLGEQSVFFPTELSLQPIKC